MSARSRQCKQLGEALSKRLGIPVELIYTGEPDRQGHGAWKVTWTDGPTPESMRVLVDQMGGAYPLADGPRLGFSRHRTDFALTTALLGWLSRHPDEAEVEFLSLTMDFAYDRTEFPERLDDRTQRRARTLMRAGGGEERDVLTSEAFRLLGEHCRHGWAEVVRWLDELAALAEGRASGTVVDLDAVRKQRSEQR